MAIFPTFLGGLGNIGHQNVFYDLLQRKNAFLLCKNKKFKKSKNWYFSKGVNPWFWSKNANFRTFFWAWAIQARKMSFTIFQNEKTPFQAIKTRSSKSPKIDIFPKGLTHGFRSKMAIFPTFFFKGIQARKISFTIFQNEKMHFQAIKTRSSKSPKFDIFPKGSTHGLGPKMGIFPTFFKGNIGQENVFYDILERKNGFLGYKNKKFKKSKNLHFCKGVSHFSNFFGWLRQYRPPKCLLRYSRTKKRVSIM